MNCSPRADVAPADFRGEHENTFGSVLPGFSVRSARTSRRLHNGVIHGNVLEPRIDPVEGSRIFGRADELLQLAKRTPRFREIFPQAFQKSGNAPEKHPRVPEISPRRHVSFRARRVRLLRKSLHNVCWHSVKPYRHFRALDVAESRLRMRWRNSQHHEVSWVAGNLHCRANDFAILRRVGNVMIRW